MLRNFKTWYWLLVPMLAIIAYATVVRIGFLGDDLVLIANSPRHNLSLEALLPQPGGFLYRPLGLLFIWDLGALLWGNNPLPFHIQGLLLHALTSLVLGLWAAEVTSRRVLGWLAGSIFAVFPLHMEAVGWVAAQWDVLSALFGITGLWLFTIWWRTKNRFQLLLLSVLLYSLALFTKDSLVTFVPLFALSAWLVTPSPTRRDLQRLALALLPFCAVLALNLSLRIMVWGNLGGYAGIRTDYWNFFWDGLINQIHALLSPVNTLVFGDSVAQLVGALSTLALLVGLALFGRKWVKLLVVSCVWILLVLLPVLNLPIKLDDLQQNRLLYLASGGYCTVVAALLYSAIHYAKKWKSIALSSVGILLLLGIGVCWAQLRPWHTATVQVNELEQELLRLIPPPATPRSNVMTWYTEGSPHNYKGAYLVDLALGMQRAYTGKGDVPVIRRVLPAADAPVVDSPFDAFALRFAYYENETRYHVDYAAGITSGGPPPSSEDSGSGLLVWDFRSCSSSVISRWRVSGAQGSCEPGENGGMALRNSLGDAQLIGPPIETQPTTIDARFVRLRVSVRYPAQSEAGIVEGQWFWHGPGEIWNEDRSRQFSIKRDGVPHVYWTFIPTSELDAQITNLRLDPSNSKDAAVIQWLALDLVK